MTAKLEAEHTGISIATLTKIKQGAEAVAMGSSVQGLDTLPLEPDLLKVAADNELGRQLQDLGLPIRARAAKRRSR